MKKKVAFIQVIFFIAIAVFFIEVAPLLPFDGDDWRYIGTIRAPFPKWGGWNPTRVLPEVLMPLGGYFSAFIVYPFTHNYIFSLTLVSNLIISFFVVLLVFMYYRLIRIRLKLGIKISLVLESLFLLSFFVIFKHVNSISYYGFWTVDLACGFFYIIPGCLNASLVMYMLQSENFNNYFLKLPETSKSFFIIVLYFTLLSNTQMTIILALYCCFEIIKELFKSKFNFKGFIGNTWLYLSILFLWLITILFDLNGQRSHNVSQNNKGSLYNRLQETLIQFKNLIMTTNKGFLVLSIALIIIGTFILLRKPRTKARSYLTLIIFTLISTVLAFGYLLIAYVKAGSFYANRIDAMWPVLYFYLFLVNLCIASCTCFIKEIKLVLPLITVLASIIVINANGLYVYPNNSPYAKQTIINIDNNIINQIIKADHQGKNSVNVTVPLDQKNANKKVTTSNWPHSYDMAKWLQNTLYSHHIIRTRMQINFVPNEKANKLYENKKNEQSFIPLE